MAAPMTFSQAKKTRLKTQDLSKKGSIDEEILDLVNYINDTEYFCTTSSCSGRIIVICEGNDEITKKGCHWLYVSHKMTDLVSVETCLKDLQGKAVFKYEPFILHVHCRNLEDAKLMHVVAVESGFRNSGITIGKAGKVMVAVRSTHGLEVPLSDGVKVLVSSEYLAFLVQQANSKLLENSKRITRFHTNLLKRLDTHTPQTNAIICNHCSRTKVNLHSKHKTSDMDTSKTKHSNETKYEISETLREKFHSAVNMPGREPTPTSCDGLGVRQTRDMDTSEKRTNAHDFQGQVSCDVGINSVITDDSDVLFGLDFFT